MGRSLPLGLHTSYSSTPCFELTSICCSQSNQPFKRRTSLPAIWICQGFSHGYSKPLQSTPAFGQSQAAFGQSSSPSFGFGQSSSAFGASSSVFGKSTGSSIFGQASTPAFGGASSSAPFGSTGFGQTSSSFSTPNPFGQSTPGFGQTGYFH